MLSILIPTYNADCIPLISMLYMQANNLNIPFEIILADDASNNNYRIINAQISKWNNCRYIQLDKNIGPALIRNFLADQSLYPYLLFLDSDVLPIDNDFLHKYINNASPNSAICGGFVYKRDSIPQNAILRFKYGMSVEEQSSESRSKHPFHSFISMNFMICKEAFNRVRFNETFHLGYEDTLFGKELEQKKVDIIHLDNPVFHCVEESSEQFLLKIERAVRNLIGHEDSMRSYVKLLKWHHVVKKFGMQPLVAFVFDKTYKSLQYNLIGKHPSLYIFAFYKLGYLCSICHKKHPTI